MAKNLLIVESPAKAKTIEAILGKDFQVKSCFGHIRDLEKNDMGIDINNNFKPKYIVPADKERVVKELKSLAKSSDEVWLASDEDREGESISWHLAEVLNLDPKTMRLVVFGSRFKTSAKCQLILSPSRSSSDASHTSSLLLARLFNSFTTFSLSAGTIYFGLKLLLISMPISFFSRSRIWPKQLFT